MSQQVFPSQKDIGKNIPYILRIIYPVFGSIVPVKHCLLKQRLSMKKCYGKILFGTCSALYVSSHYLPT